MNFWEPRRMSKFKTSAVQRNLAVTISLGMILVGVADGTHRHNSSSVSSALAQDLTLDLLNGDVSESLEHGLFPSFLPNRDTQEGLGGEDDTITEEDELKLLGGDLFTDQLEGPARPGSTIERMRRKFDLFYERFVFQNQDFLDLNSNEDSIPTLLPVDHFTMTSGFGVRKSPFSGRSRVHRGIDLRASYGTDVKAAGSGRVVSTTYHRSYGRMVILDHGNGLESRYAHNSKIHVKVGDQVKKGQLISQIGMTGRTTGPHLHFEIWLHGHPINPLKFVDVPFHLIAREAFLRSKSGLSETNAQQPQAGGVEIDHDE
ncbi:MAG: M23 family metallopeptidase [Pseudomonadota bacterium]